MRGRSPASHLAWKSESSATATSYLEGQAQFNRWLAEVEREAREAVWTEGTITKSNSSSIVDQDVLVENPYAPPAL